MDDDTTIDDVISITDIQEPVDISTVTLPTDLYSSPSYTVSLSSTSSYYSSIGVIGGGLSPSGSFLYSNGSNSNPTWSNTIATTQSTNSIDVKGDASFDGDILWKGQSLGKMIEAIHDRLAILQPDPAKLEKYAALKKAYDHYKLMEKLIGED
jgi:hypothetical protein